MYINKSIYINQRNGNLHIDLVGNFNSSTAEVLTSAMVASYSGKGNIFIKTAKVTDIASDSKDIFNQLLNCSGLPRKNIYLMGERGMDIGASGTKILIPRKKSHSGHGCGKCKNCTCLKKKSE